MQKVAVLGDLDMIIGFRGLGLYTREVKSAAEAETVLKDLAKADYGVIYLSEAIAAENPSLLEPYRKRITPALILIPSGRGGSDFALSRLKEQVKRAVGIDILSTKKK